MLNYDLLHPEVLEALASAGHGSKVLIADGHYPFDIGRHPGARVIFLNFAPNLLSVEQVLRGLRTAVNFEAAALMVPSDGSPVAAHADYRAELGPSVSFHEADRFEFYELARSPDVGIVIATGELRVYANILLTIGLRTTG
jgi:L-fucose mutarotase